MNGVDKSFQEKQAEPEDINGQREELQQPLEDRQAIATAKRKPEAENVRRMMEAAMLKADEGNLMEWKAEVEKHAAKEARAAELKAVAEDTKCKAEATELEAEAAEREVEAAKVLELEAATELEKAAASEVRHAVCSAAKVARSKAKKGKESGDESSASGPFTAHVTLREGRVAQSTWPSSPPLSSFCPFVHQRHFPHLPLPYLFSLTSLTLASTRVKSPGHLPVRHTFLAPAPQSGRSVSSSVRIVLPAHPHSS